MYKKYSSLILLLLFGWLQSIQSQELLPDSLSDSQKAVFLNTLASKQTQLDSALFYTEEAIKYAKQCTCDSILQSTMFKISLYPAIYGKYSLSLKESSHLDSLLKVKPNSYFSFRMQSLLAYNYRMQDQLNIALDYYKKALDESVQTKDSLLIADAYNNLGDAFNSIELKDKARKYFLKALEIFNKKQGTVNSKYIIYNNLSRTAKSLKEALFYSDKAYTLISDSNNPQNLSLFYLTRADALRLQEAYNLSAEAYKKSYEIARKINYDLVKNIALIYLGEVNLKRGLTKKAIKNLEEASKMSQPNLENYKVLLQNLSQAYALNHDYKKAFAFSKKMTTINDSIFKLKSSKDFAAFDVKYNTELKDKEIAEQQLQLAKQKITKNIYISVSILLFVFAVVLFQSRINKQKRKKLLTEVALQKEQELNEMRTKLLGNIAHEIRTPLTLISGNLDLALENIGNKEKILKNIKVALSNSKKVVEDANEILELLKFEKNKTTIKRTPVNLNATVKRIYLSFKSLAHLKQIRLDYQSTIDTDFMADIDVEKLEKILNNLISNAIKYSNSRSKIILEAKITNDKLCINVTDFGQGIHYDETEKIFQRFYQASNSKAVGGIGIGLSLASEFAKLLDGSLSVKSKLDEGSTFTLVLPVNKSKTEALKTPRNQELTTIKNTGLKEVSNKTDKPKILIVEDNPEMNNFLKEILSDKYTCTSVFNGLEALKILEKHPFDLITSDIMMPLLDGFELRKKINDKLLLKDIPFILISAKTLTEYKIKGFKLGIDDYIIKPFNKNELLARIANLLNNKKARLKWQIDNKNLIENTESSDKKLLYKIENIVLENLSDDSFKINKLATEIGYSQRQLSRILKQYTGLSPVRFILEIRLQKAYQLLKNKTYFSLSEVRYDVGINSTSYFNSKFKERFGIMPSELIKTKV